MKKIITLVLLLLGVLFIGIGIGLIGKQNNNNNTNNNNNNNNNEVIIDEFSKYNGIYKKDNTIIKLYELSDNRLYYEISGTSGIANINQDNAIATYLENNYIFTVNDNVLTFTTNSNDYPNGEYEKTQEYTYINVFNDKYGESTYLNTRYNGDYSSKEYTIYMFQINANVVIVYTSYNGNTASLLYNIMDDGSLVTRLENTEIKIIVNNDNIIYQANGTQDEVNKLNGTHNKVKNLTIKDILNNIY